jgi:hypothetical protein
MPPDSGWSLREYWTGFRMDAGAPGDSDPPGKDRNRAGDGPKEGQE